MKTILLSVVCLFAISMAYAQEDDNEMKTIFGSPKNVSHGGFGAVSVGYSNIMNRDALLMGARGAWVVNHNFALGVGGYGFMTDPKNDVRLNNEQYEIGGGYGGFIIEPIVGAKKPIHLSFPLLIGAGGIVYDKNWRDKDYEENVDTYEDSDAFFVIEPGVEVELNMLKFMRVALSVSYRYTTDINLNYKESTTPTPTAIGPESMLRGFNYGMIFKFGKF